MSQVASEQRRHKISYLLQTKSETEKESLIQSLRGRLQSRESSHRDEVCITVDRLAEKGIKAQVLFSGGKDLDVLPTEAGKGQALAYLLEEVSFRTSTLAS